MIRRAFLTTVLLCLSVTAGAQNPTTTHLHTFTGAMGEGTRPIAALVQGHDSLFYGVTKTGGSGFLPIGPLFVLIGVQQTSGRVCADWKLLDTGP